MTITPNLMAMWLAVIVGAMGLLHAPGRAETWTTYQVGEATFEVPAGWSTTRSRRNREIILSNAARWELRVEWWFQDEPILGYDDIISHKRITVGGKPATWTHSSFPNRMVITAVLDEKRKDGRKLLIVLEMPGRDATPAIRLFDDILARVRLRVAG